MGTSVNRGSMRWIKRLHAGRVGGPRLGRDLVVLEEEGEVVLAVGLRAQAPARRRVVLRADVVDARDEPAQDGRLLVGELLRRAPADPGKSA